MGGRNVFQIIVDGLETFWFSIVGIMFVIQIVVVPMFQLYAIMYVHEIERQAIESEKEKKVD